MLEKINEKVSVITLFDQKNNTVMPIKIKWQGKIYIINKLGYHHKLKQGSKLIHVFSVCDQNLAFRLCLDTDNLHWTLKEISDGLAS